MSYQVWNYGEWVYPVKKGFKLMCCDCGLVHTMDFEIENGRIKVRMRRDGKATGGARKNKVKDYLHKK